MIMMMKSVSLVEETGVPGGKLGQVTDNYVCMDTIRILYGWMDVCVYVCMHECMDGRTDRYMYQWRIHWGGAGQGIIPPPPQVFFGACQYMKIPADLDPTPRHQSSFIHYYMVRHVFLLFHRQVSIRQVLPPHPTPQVCVGRQ